VGSIALPPLVIVCTKSPPPVRVPLLRAKVTVWVIGFTVIVAVAVKFPSTVVTVIVAVPCPTAVTTPFDTVATAVLFVVQVTFWSVAVTGAMVAVKVVAAPSINVVAVGAIDTLVTATAVSDTVITLVAVWLPSAVVTVMVAVPADSAVTTPFNTVAIVGSLVVQVTA